MCLLTAQELALFIKAEGCGLYNTILGRRGCIQHPSHSFLSPVCNIHVSKANRFLEYSSSLVLAIYNWLKSREMCKWPIGPGCLTSGTPEQSNNMDQPRRQ